MAWTLAGLGFAVATAGCLGVHTEGPRAHAEEDVAEGLGRAWNEPERTPFESESAGVAADPPVDFQPGVEPVASYPIGPYGYEVGDVVPSFSLPGRAATEGIDGEIGTTHFWRMAHRAEDRRTLLVMALISLTCPFGNYPAALELETWQRDLGGRGFGPWGITIQQTYEDGSAFWEGELGHTHPWAADQAFSTGQFFPGPMVGTPAFVLIDLCTMRIVERQEGYSGVEEQLFEGYLDRSCEGE